MCLLIPGTAGTLFAAMPIWSANYIVATPQEWPVRITGMQAVLVTGMVQQGLRVFRATRLQAHRHTVLESRQDMQRQDIQLQAMRPQERYISRESLPDSLATAHALALRALHVGQAPAR
jgi:hypothetical protein